jgi:signal peptidase I
VNARAVAVRVAVLALAAAATAWALPRYTVSFVGGASMYPALIPGDLVVLRRGSADLRQGDIVLVAKPGWPHGVLHRVDSLLADGTVRLRGDANTTPDRDPVELWRVRGVAIGVVGFGRFFSALEQLAARWYNRGSQATYRGDDGEARALRAPPAREKPSHHAVRASGGERPAVHSISRILEGPAREVRERAA